MLTLEIELLTGVYRASLPDGSGAEWPPHPERIFSALVQAWGDGGRRPIERAALEWLEAQELPVIDASIDVCERDAPAVYVPPNDARGTEVAVLPERRRRQARAFHAAIPAVPVVRLHWNAEPGDDTRSALQALAHRVASVGHSASLVRAEFRAGEVIDPDAAWMPDPRGRAVLRAPYAGRLADLESWFAADGEQPVERPRSLRPERYRLPLDVQPAAAIARSVFGGASDWFVFEDAGGSGGFRPDLLAFGHVARRMRHALMSLGAQPTPEILSGHGPAGGPSARPHVAVVPLANVGWNHSTGDLLGFAVVLPRATDSDERRSVLLALAEFVKSEGDLSTGHLNVTADRVWTVERTTAPSRSSLKPDRWCGVSRTWGSATPVLLDRFPDHGDAGGEAAIIAAACRNVGLPEPVEIEIHKHSAITAAPSAYPARGDRARIDWAIPRDASYRDRPRRHVVLTFAESVEGPVILGAGRYHGFGLCLPLDGGRSG